MTKNEFLRDLRNKLAALPQDEIEERLLFYSEMIDDRMEDGLPEDEAVSAIGAVGNADTKTFDEVTSPKPVKEKEKTKKRLRVWEIVLLVLGSPLWLTLLLAAIAVVAAIYICLWAVVISLWAVFVSLAACSIGGLFGGALLIARSEPLSGAFIIGCAVACAGLSVFAFFGCRVATRGAVWLTKKSAIGIKKLFFKKEET